MSYHRALPEGAFIDDEGVWVQIIRRPDGAQPRAGLFLDRDGVIVEEVGHLSRPQDVRLIAGAADVVRSANERGIPVVIVSNQSGIGRGLFGWDAFIDVQDTLHAMLAQEGAFVDGVLACPHHGEGKPPYDQANHPARKPNPGMLLRAARLLPMALAESWIIGDRAQDLASGRNAGLAGGVLVATGYGRSPAERQAALALAADGRFRVIVGASIGVALTALPLLLDEGAV